MTFAGNQSRGWNWARSSHGNIDAAPVSQQSAGFPAYVGSHQRHDDTLLVPPLRPANIAFKSSLGHDVIMTGLAVGKECHAAGNHGGRLQEPWIFRSQQNTAVL